MDNSKKLTHLSLCTGYGGIDLGLQRALTAVRTICYVEIEAYSICNLVKKVEQGLLDIAPIYTDLKTLPWELFNRRVDILSGGFPCQPFSAAGKKAGDEDPRHLFPYIAKGIRICKPSLIFLENVSGIISSKLKGDKWEDPEGTPVLLHVLRQLERMGYRATAGIFSAREVGAPHQRKRVFILAIRDELTEESINRVSEYLRTSKPNRTIYPASRGRKQRWYEPSRVTVEHSNSKRQLRDKDEPSATKQEGARQKEQNGYYAQTSTPSGGIQRQAKPQMGRDANGAAHWVDYGELYQSSDNRTDELRLLGNGVLPQTAERAFRTLWEKLGYTYC